MRRLLAVLVLLTGGCAALVPPPEGCVRLAREASLCPLPPSALPQLQASHVLTVQHEGQRDSFVASLRIGPGALQLAGASLFGTPLFRIRWDGRRFVTAPADSDLRPQLVLAMLQVALADPAALQPGLHGLRLTVRQLPDGEVRSLHAGAELVAEVTRHGAPLAAARLDIRVPRAKLQLHLVPLSGISP